MIRSSRTLVVVAGVGCMLAAGATGATADVPDRQIRVGAAVVQPGASGEAVAVCPTGTTATGGGYLNVGALDGGAEVVVGRSQPDADGWRVTAFNTTGAARTIQAYAVCAAVERTVALDAAPVPAGGRGLADAACPAGSTATGGGFINLDALSGGTMTVGLSRENGTGWAVDAYNPTTRASTVWAVAVCVADTTGGGIRVGSTAVQPGAQGSAVAQCPTGTAATGGGFHNVDTLQLGTDVVVSASRPSGTGWEVIAHNRSSTPRWVFTYAICR
jgi:hypothetical protein